MDERELILIEMVFLDDERHSDVARLVAEVRRLHAQVEGHCERIAKQSELLYRSAEKAPSYRRDLPTEPGWYWMRSPGGEPRIVEVFYHNRRDATDGLHWHGTWSSGFIREPHADYWWAGPIKEPPWTSAGRRR